MEHVEHVFSVWTDGDGEFFIGESLPDPTGAPIYASSLKLPLLDVAQILGDSAVPHLAAMRKSDKPLSFRIQQVS